MVEQKEGQPLILIKPEMAKEMIDRLSKESVVNEAELSRYRVMEGMQNELKIPFFTELIDDDDVLRMNTIESYVTIFPLMYRRVTKANWDKIQLLMKSVYEGHVIDHKTNMVSKGRGRESAYVKILSNEHTEIETSTWAQKFFGIGGKKK